MGENDRILGEILSTAQTLVQEQGRTRDVLADLEHRVSEIEHAHRRCPVVQSPVEAGLPRSEANSRAAILAATEKTAGDHQRIINLALLLLMLLVAGGWPAVKAALEFLKLAH